MKEWSHKEVAYLATCRDVARKSPETRKILRRPELMMPGAAEVGTEVHAAARQIFLDADTSLQGGENV